MNPQQRRKQVSIKTIEANLKLYDSRPAPSAERLELENQACFDLRQKTKGMTRREALKFEREYWQKFDQKEITHEK